MYITYETHYTLLNRSRPKRASSSKKNLKIEMQYYIPLKTYVDILENFLTYKQALYYILNAHSMKQNNVLVNIGYALLLK